MFKNTSRLAALGFLTVVASGNMSRRMYRWTLGLLLIGALAATAMPAMAQTPVTTFQYGGASNFNFPCFGYTGTFLGGTDIAKVDWQGEGVVDECFGIAPDRTIWHTWPKAGGWQQMPYGGRADNTGFGYRDRDDNRTITVQVYGPPFVIPLVTTLWESTYVSAPGSRGWQKWVQFVITKQ